MNSYGHMVIVNNNSDCYDFYIVVADTEKQAEDLAISKYSTVLNIGLGEPLENRKPNIDLDDNGVSQLFTVHYKDSV